MLPFSLGLAAKVFFLSLLAFNREDGETAYFGLFLGVVFVAMGWLLR